MVVEHEHPAARRHLRGEQTGARAAIEEGSIGGQRDRSPEPVKHHVALPGVVPVVAFNVGEVVILSSVHSGVKTLFRRNEFSKFKACPLPLDRTDLPLLRNSSSSRWLVCWRCILPWRS